MYNITIRCVMITQSQIHYTYLKAMSNKNNPHTIEVRNKIKLAKQENRKEVLGKIIEYCDKLEETKKPPSIVSACLYAQIGKRALLRWEQDEPPEADIRLLLEYIRMREEQYLRDGALLGIIDSKIATLLLKAEHGVNDMPTQLTQNNTFNISPELLSEALKIAGIK